MHQLSKLTLLNFIIAAIAIIYLVAPAIIPARAEDGNSNSTANGNGTKTTSTIGGDDDSTSITDKVKSQRDTVTASLKTLQEAEKEFSSTKSDGAKATVLTVLKKHGDNVADARLKALSELSNRINNGVCSKIADTTMEATLTNDVKTMTATLTTQKTTIDSETDLAQLKIDVKAVYENDRIFATFIPAINGTCISERVIETIDSKITPEITKIKAAGIDTTTAETDFAAAKASAQTALALYEKVAATPAGVIPNPDLKTALKDLQAARKSMGDGSSTLAKVVDTYKAGLSDSSTNSSSGLGSSTENSD